MNGNTMRWCDTELCTNGVEANKFWVFIVHFFFNVLLDVEFLVCVPTTHRECDARMQNWQIKSPPALWRPLQPDVSLLWMARALAWWWWWHGFGGGDGWPQPLRKRQIVNALLNYQQVYLFKCALKNKLAAPIKKFTKICSSVIFLSCITFRLVQYYVIQAI